MPKHTLRKLLAVILGLIAGNAVFLLMGIFAERLYPTPPELLDPQTPEATALRVATAETIGLLLVLLGSTVGGFVAGLIGAAVARERILPVTFGIGALLSLWALYSFYIFFPARLWFPIGMLTSFLLFSYLGGFAITHLGKNRTARE